MKNEDIDDGDIASFAESVIKEDRKSGPALVQTPQGIIKGQGVDLQKVRLSDDILREVLSTGFGEKLAPIAKKTLVVKEEKKTQKTKTPEQFTVELVGLINQAKTLIKEMTDCGSIGVNQASGWFSMSLKPKKKNKKKYHKQDLSAKLRERFGLK